MPAGGGAPTVTLRLSDDLGFGLRDLPASTISFALAQLSPPPATGASSEWRSYITNSRTNPPDVQASTEGATSGTFTDNGDGTYEYTFANALSAYPAGPAYDASEDASSRRRNPHQPRHRVQHPGQQRALRFRARRAARRRSRA